MLSIKVVGSVVDDVVGKRWYGMNIGKSKLTYVIMHKKSTIFTKNIVQMVEVTGFEPATFWSRTKIIGSKLIEIK